MPPSLKGERRKQVPDMRFGKGLQRYLFMLPKDGQATKKNMFVSHYWCENVDYIP
jgi:hypothetical protein